MEILISLEAQRESFELYCSESVMNDINGLFETLASLYLQKQMEEKQQVKAAQEEKTRHLGASSKRLKMKNKFN